MGAERYLTSQPGCETRDHRGTRLFIFAVGCTASPWATRAGTCSGTRYFAACHDATTCVRVLFRSWSCGFAFESRDSSSRLISDRVSEQWESVDRETFYFGDRWGLTSRRVWVRGGGLLTLFPPPAAARSCLCRSIAEVQIFRVRLRGSIPRFRLSATSSCLGGGVCARVLHQ